MSAEQDRTGDEQDRVGAADAAGTAAGTPVAPAGNEIHLPGPSLQPVLLTIGITAALVGVTSFRVLLYGGVLLTVLVLVRWVADARRDIAHLPAHSDH